MKSASKAKEDHPKPHPPKRIKTNYVKIQLKSMGGEKS
jgi:hypothetical protein